MPGQITVLGEDSTAQLAWIRSDTFMFDLDMGAQSLLSTVHSRAEVTSVLVQGVLGSLLVILFLVLGIFVGQGDIVNFLHVSIQIVSSSEALITEGAGIRLDAFVLHGLVGAEGPLCSKSCSAFLAKELGRLTVHRLHVFLCLLICQVRLVAYFTVEESIDAFGDLGQVVTSTSNHFQSGLIGLLIFLSFIIIGTVSLGGSRLLFRLVSAAVRIFFLLQHSVLP